VHDLSYTFYRYVPTASASQASCYSQGHEHPSVHSFLYPTRHTRLIGCDSLTLGIPSSFNPIGYFRPWGLAAASYEHTYLYTSAGQHNQQWRLDRNRLSSPWMTSSNLCA
jgi:hypothetical protein